MAERVFGVITGAGTRVVERQAPPPIQAGDLNSTLITGWFRSGPVDQVVSVGGDVDRYRRIFGGLKQGQFGPLESEHLLEMSKGAANLYVMGIKSSTAAAAALRLYDRDVDLSVLEGTPPAKLALAVASLEANNPGRHGGREDYYFGVASLPGDLTTVSTITLAELALTPAVAGRWVGATIRFPTDDAAFSAKVISDDGAGILGIQGVWSDDVTAGSDGAWTLELPNEHELTADLEALAVEVTDGGELPASQFSLLVYRDGSPVKAWENAEVDSSGRAYWFDAVDGDGDNFEIEPEDLFAGDASDALDRPANFAEIPAPAGVADTVLHFQTVRWARTTTGGADPYLDTVSDWGHPTVAIPMSIVCTFDGAGNFTPVFTLPNGEAVTGPATAFGAPVVTGRIFPGFVINDGSVAPSASDTLTITYRPLPADLKTKGCWLYPAAAPSEGDVRTRFLVIDSDADSVTVPAGSALTSSCTAPGAPSHSGTIAGPFDMSTGSDTVIYSAGGRGPYTLTSSLSGAAETAAAVAADFNARELARSGGASDNLVEFTVSNDKITATALQDFGPDAALLLGAGTMNAIAGFTAASYAGATPKIARLQWRQELVGGRDGLEDLAASDRQAPFLAVSGYLVDLLAMNTGLIKLMTPGVTSVPVMVTAQAWAYDANALYFPEVPSSVTTEAAAIAWWIANLATGPAQDYSPLYWPSYGKIANPYGSGLLAVPLIGAILGVHARKALELGGYHNAPAGRDYSLRPLVKDLATEDRVLNGELLNGAGLIEVRRRGAEIYLWGDRIPGRYGRLWLHKRATTQHVSRTMLINSDALTFQRISSILFARARRQVRGLFTTWWLAGWFSDADGPGFNDQVAIKCDETNNPSTERQGGRLNVSVAFDVANTSEQVVISHGPKGVVEVS
jgi:hypothetical protein